jgi:hypothetical protein
MARDISTYLRAYSPHWTHRAVRLWFNNNRHTFLSLIPLPQPPPPLPQAVAEFTAYPFPFFQIPPPLRTVASKPMPPPWTPAPDATPDHAYIPISKFLAELRRGTEGDPKFARQIQDFDSGCQQLLSKFGSVRPEKIDAFGKYVRFDLTELSGKAANGIWQVRPFGDVALPAFECADFGEDLAAVVSGEGSQRTLTVWRYRAFPPEFTTFKFESRGLFDGMCVAGSCAWFLSKATLVVVPFGRFDSLRTVPLRTAGTGTMAPFRDGVLIGFSHGTSLFMADTRGETARITHFFKGINCLASVGNRIVCAVTGSGVIRLLDADFRESHVFIGHCGTVLLVR